jgi:DNA-binding GntR family transcriptional regulator
LPQADAGTIVLAEKAYLHIKGLLLEGDLRPGDRLPTDELAAKLKISRQPVMDAIRRLASEGFVDIVPQVGSRVRQSSEDEIRDFFRLFAAGEALIAELAATRASASDVTNLRMLSNQIGELRRLKPDNADRGRLYRTLNRQLHAELRRIIQSPALAEIVEGLGDRSDFYIASASEPVFAPNLNQAHSEHEAVIKAIANGWPDLARQAMEEHIHATESRLLRNIEPPRAETQS